MLAEALVYARARLAGEADPYGHLAEQVSIWSRRRRCRAAWEEHLSRARRLCLDAAEALPANRRRTALVLGAGLLHDVPLAELSARFRRVVLADMNFLPAVRRAAGALGNVECRTVDLSGCMDRIPAFAARDEPPPAPVPDLSLGLPDADFAYSANLLSQMPLFALGALRRGNPRLSAAVRERFAASLVRAHVAALRALPAACLVTDLRERGLRRGEPRYEMDLLYGAAPQLPGSNWIWRIAPAGEAARGLDVERDVLGAPDVRATPAREAA